MAFDFDDIDELVVNNKKEEIIKEEKNTPCKYCGHSKWKNVEAHEKKCPENPNKIKEEKKEVKREKVETIEPIEIITLKKDIERVRESVREIKVNQQNINVISKVEQDPSILILISKIEEVIEKSVNYQPKTKDNSQIQVIREKITEINNENNKRQNLIEQYIYSLSFGNRKYTIYNFNNPQEVRSAINILNTEIKQSYLDIIQELLLLI